MKTKILMLAALLVLVGLAALGAYLKSVSDYKKMVRETSFDEIDISTIPDGSYVGEYDVNFIYAKVEVTVQNGEIANIVILEHKHDRGEAAEAVIGRIVDAQQVDVDAISGATNSSVVLKKAVANALAGK